MSKEEILDIYNEGMLETTGFLMDVLNFDRELNYHK